MNNLNSMPLLIWTMFTFLLVQLFTYRKHRQDRADQYFFVILEKRFQVHQEAYSLCKRAISAIHKDDKHGAFWSEALDWYNSNALYLAPGLREDMRIMIHTFAWYPDKLDYRRGLWQSGDKTEAEKVGHEVKKDWDFLTSEIIHRIESEMAPFYTKLESDMVPYHILIGRKLGFKSKSDGSGQ